MKSNRPPAKGRGSFINPPNRFLRIDFEDDFEHLEHDELLRAQLRSVPTQYYVDDSKTILTENSSPDIPFRYSLNPYRGCSHGCSYCYARPTHEYLGFSAGLDFETMVMVKQDAPRLFQDHLAGDGWEPEPIMMSGVTDCYQPAERTFRLTRGCLEVAWEARQPMCIVTKNALVTRDLDLLAQLASMQLATAALSITTLDAALARVMEPRTSSPASRLRAVAQLAEAGVPTSVMVAPVIPGLNDSEIPAILQQAQQHGAESASYILLRLPSTVQPVFLQWLERAQPHKKARIESLTRSTRNGALNESEFGTRMRGRGAYAEQIRQTFGVFARRFGLDQKPAPLDATKFRRPQPSSGQLRLF